MWNIRDKEIDEFSDSKHEVTEDDDECKFECEDIPVFRGQPALIIPEGRVVTGGLQE